MQQQVFPVQDVSVAGGPRSVKEPAMLQQVFPMQDVYCRRAQERQGASHDAAGVPCAGCVCCRRAQERQGASHAAAGVPCAGRVCCRRTSPLMDLLLAKELCLRCFMQGYLGSHPQLERGALGSVLIAGGAKMKLLAIWFCGNRSMAEGASEDRLAHLLICWRRTPGSKRLLAGSDG